MLRTKRVTTPLTHARLLKMLHYDPATGIFRWLKNPRRKRLREGGIAGSTSKAPGRGYCVIGIEGRLYRAQRLAWFYMTKRWPRVDIDHINRVRDDNRWSNLREASQSENRWNMSKSSRNTSGYKGITWDKTNQKWRARICVFYHTTRLGQFNTIEGAIDARRIAAEKLHGEFATDG